ncbi:MAG: hypothetical protein ACRDL2_09720, partial [Gaiellaceae bacterium]
MRRIWAVVALLALVAGASLAYGQVTGTFAIFTAETKNADAQALGGSVDQATSPQLAVAGYGASLTWQAGATGVASEEIDAADG